MKSIISVVNNITKDLKKCNPLALYIVLSMTLVIFEISQDSIHMDQELLIDAIVALITGGFIYKLCKSNKHKPAYGILSVYIVYWIINRYMKDEPVIVSGEQADNMAMINAMNAMNANMNGNVKETFQQCQQNSGNSADYCRGDYNDSANSVGVFAGAPAKCGEVGHCNMADYYNQRAGWANSSMPDKPAVVAPNCHSQSPLFDRPCSMLETPVTKLRNYPINTDTHQPHYRLCHEDSRKVQIAHDPHSQPYVSTNDV